MTQYKSYVSTVNITENSNLLRSNCQRISFVNQGVTGVKIFPGRSSGYKLLPPGSSTSYGTENESVTETTEFSVEFIGVGVNDLVVEKQFFQVVEPIATVKKQEDLIPIEKVNS